MKQKLLPSLLLLLFVAAIMMAGGCSQSETETEEPNHELFAAFEKMYGDCEIEDIHDIRKIDPCLFDGTATPEKRRGSISDSSFFNDEFYWWHDTGEGLTRTEPFIQKAILERYEIAQEDLVATGANYIVVYATHETILSMAGNERIVYIQYHDGHRLPVEA